MGLFSKKKQKSAPDDPLQPTSSVYQYQSPEVAQTTSHSSHQAKPEASPETHADPTFKISRHGSAGNPIKWPAAPQAGDYKTRVAALGDAEKADGKGNRKSWLARKLNLAGPGEKEYYDRRFKEDGEGSDYEKAAKIAQPGGIAFLQ